MPPQQSIFNIYAGLRCDISPKPSDRQAMIRERGVHRELGWGVHREVGRGVHRELDSGVHREVKMYMFCHKLDIVHLRT